MVLIIGGILGLALAGGFFWGFKKNASKIMLIKSTKTTTAAELKDTHEAIVKELGTGAFREIVELKGKIACTNPIRSELSNQPCVWYSFTVSREYEETVTAPDNEGRQVQQIRRGSEVVASNTNFANFTVNDATGSISVDLEKAEIQSLKSHSSFQPGDPQPNSRIGNFVFSSSTNFGTSARHTLGYRLEEFILPLDRDVFVLGEASDASGSLKVVKPEKSELPFLVSLKSEEELVKGAMSAETGFLIGSITLGLGGLTALIFGIINLLNS